MFRTVPLSIIRSFSLYTQQWYMSYRFADSLRAGSGRHVSDSSSVHHQEFLTVHTAMVYVIQVFWHITLLCVQWKTPDDGQRNCPKHIEFYSKNKFEKLVHLVGFIIRVYHDARSPERQNLSFYWVWHCTLINTSTFRLCLITLLLCLQQCNVLFTFEPCILLLSKFFLSPTDA